MIDFQNIDVTTLNSNRLELGEGPTYDPQTDTAWWFNIVGYTLHEHRFFDKTTHIHKLPRMASMLAKINDDSQIIAMEDGLYIRTISNGQLKLSIALEAENPITRSNDGRCHPSGSLWIGTMGKNCEKHAGAIYWYNGKDLKKIFEKVTIPNAICFSRDGSIGYFTDTDTGILNCVALDPATGLPVGEPSLFFDNRSNNGGLDGAVTDANDIVWNARWGASCVDAYTPDGKKIGSIKLPTKQVTCPAFCSLDATKMIVTSAWQNQSEKQKSLNSEDGTTLILSGGFEGKFDSHFKFFG